MTVVIFDELQVAFRPFEISEVFPEFANEPFGFLEFIGVPLRSGDQQDHLAIITDVEVIRDAFAADSTVFVDDRIQVHFIGLGLFDFEEERTGSADDIFELGAHLPTNFFQIFCRHEQGSTVSNKPGWHLVNDAAEFWVVSKELFRQCCGRFFQLLTIGAPQADQ